jgi:1-pyrroline-5-carboxylate dehydrogenase
MQTNIFKTINPSRSILKSTLKTNNSKLKFYSFFSINSKTFSLKLKDFSVNQPKNPKIKLENFINGEWRSTNKYEEYLDPLNGKVYLESPLTEKNEMEDIITSMKNCPRHGLHNPLKNVERYKMYGDICRKITTALHDDEIFMHFVNLIKRTFPKSDAQAIGEMRVTRAFFENFCGDNVRFLARSFANPGDHYGQQTQGYRWPYGPVVLIAPFNFPLVKI